MSNKRYTIEDFLSPVQIDTPSVRDQWRRAVKGGDIRALQGMMAKADISPNFPTEVTGVNPLKTLLEADKHSSRHIDQDVAAQILIARGVELRVPDLYRMVPADYAMLSKNYEAARTVITATMLQYHEHHREEEYIPQVRGFFQTCADKSTRWMKYNIMLRNHHRLGEEFVNAVYGDDPHPIKSNFTDRQHDYWTSNLEELIPFKDLPRPSRSLKRALNRQQQEREYYILGEGEPTAQITRDSHMRLHEKIERSRDRVHLAIAREVLAYSHY